MQSDGCRDENIAGTKRVYLYKGINELFFAYFPDEVDKGQTLYLYNPNIKDLQ